MSGALFDLPNARTGRGNREEVASDADTDDLIASGIELLTDVSLIDDQLPPDNSHDASGIGASVAFPLTPESQQLPPGASASYIAQDHDSIPKCNSSVKRSLHFGATSSTRASHQDEKKADNSAVPFNTNNVTVRTAKTCLRLPDSPSKGQLNSVSFSADMPLLPPSSEHSTTSSDNQHHHHQQQQQQQQQKQQQQQVSVGSIVGTDMHAASSSLGITSSALEPITTRHVEKLSEVFERTKREFCRLTRLSELSSEADQHQSKSFVISSKNCSRITDGSSSDKENWSGENAFLKSLSAADLVQLLEAEVLKQRHYERKIELLNRHGLQMEKRLTVAETVVEAQRACLAQVENEVGTLTDECFDCENCRLQMCSQLLKENTDLRETVALGKAHSETIRKRCESAEIAVQETKLALTGEQKEVKNLRFQCDSLSETLRQSREDCADVRRQLSQQSMEVESMRGREHDLSTEYNELDRRLRAVESHNRQLQAELNAEKTACRLQIEQKRVEFVAKFKRTEEDFKKQLSDSLIAQANAHSKELSEAKFTCEAALKSSAEQTEHLKHDRDQYKNRLAQLEQDLDLKHHQMAAELQHKLAGKYQELLTEFGYNPYCGASMAGNFAQQPPPTTAPQGHDDSCNSVWVHNPYHTGTGNSFLTGPPHQPTAQPNSPNLAQEFLSRLRDMQPVVTPRDNQDASSASAGGSVFGRRSHLQGVLKQVLPAALSSASTSAATANAIPAANSGTVNSAHSQYIPSSQNYVNSSSSYHNQYQTHPTDPAK